MDHQEKLEPGSTDFTIEPRPSEASGEGGPPKHKKWIIIVSSIVVVLLAMGAAAYFLWFSEKESEEPAGEMPTPTPIVENSPSEALAKEGWQTYRNEEYGFEFMYPEDFEVNIDSGSVVVKKKDNLNDTEQDFAFPSLVFSSLRTRGSETLMEFVHGVSDYEKFKDLYFDESTGTFNGITVYKYAQYLGQGNRRHVFFLKDENSGIDASYYGIYISENPFQKQFDQILSTFKFIPLATRSLGEVGSSTEESVEPETVSIETILQNHEIKINDFSQAATFDHTDTIYENQRIFYKFSTIEGVAVKIDFDSEASLYIYRAPDFLREKFDEKSFVPAENGEFYLEIERTGLPLSKEVQMSKMQQSQYTLSVSVD